MTKTLFKSFVTAGLLFIGIEGWGAANWLLNQKDDLLVFLGTLSIIALVFSIPWSIYSVWRHNETDDRR